MGRPVPRHAFSYTDYLRLEETSNVRHEYFEGEIYAMAGGSPAHAALAVEIATALNIQLRGGPCRVFSSDLKLRVLATGLATYADVTVVCGPLERDPDSSVTVTNPRLVVEVTSDGSERYDRGEKLEHYRGAASIEAVILVSHREPRIDLWQRLSDGRWGETIAGAGASLEVASLGCRLVVDDIYRSAPLEER